MGLSIMKLMRKVILAAALMLAGGANAATEGNQTKSRDATVENFLVVSGLKVSLDKMPAEIAASLFTNIPPTIRDSTRNELVKGYSDAYPPGIITEAVAKSIATGRDAARLPVLMKIVSSPIAQKMTAMELKQPTPEEVKSFAATLPSKPPSKERTTLLKELLDETRSADTFSKIIEVTAESLALAASSGCPDDMKRIRDAFVKQRASVKQAVYSSVLVGMAFTYRDATDNELRDYVSTYKDSNAKEFHENLSKVVATEYLSRWKKFEMTLVRLGGELSDASMFAKSCRRSFSGTATQKVLDVPVKSLGESTQAAHLPLSGKDARQCLDYEPPLKVATCAEKYR